MALNGLESETRSAFGGEDIIQGEYYGGGREKKMGFGEERRRSRIILY